MATNDASQALAGNLPVRLLSVTVHRLNLDALKAVIAGAIDKNSSWIIAHHNFHSIYLYHHDPKMRAFYAQARHIHIDSMPLVFLGKVLGLPLHRNHRVTYVDWIGPLMAEAARHKWRIFYLGSKPGVAEKGERILRGENPGLQIKTVHGHFDARRSSPENRAVLDSINSYRPNVLMVGMGMPRQEYWILDNQRAIQADIILTCGACMDYVAGVIPTPPRWLGQIGLEWLFRLFTQPRNLWRRYLVEPWFVLELFMAELTGARRGTD